VTAEAADNELASRAAQGDRRAYALLVRRYAGPLANAARGFGVPETDVDDIVQEAFVAAWRHLANYDPARPFRGWLFRIAINKIHDLRRHRRVRRFLFAATDLSGARESGLADDGPGPERGTIARADLAKARSILDGLDRELREALVLTAIVGMSQPEAALALGTSVKSIEGRVARGRRRLAQLIDEKSLAAEGERKPGT